jgi:xanthine dehydrogenase YagS FAD-binding subunit
VEIDAFYRVPDTTPDLENVLAYDEVITGVVLPRTAAASHATYLKLRDRASFEFALVSVAAGLDIADGIITQARVALGGVATKPWHASEAERILIGNAAGEPAFKAAAQAALAGARGYGHNDFKIPLARRAVERALMSLLQTP